MLVLMSVFDGESSSREIERITQTDVGYMYMAGMQHPNYHTILRFKRDYSDLIDETFKMTIKTYIYPENHHTKEENTSTNTNQKSPPPVPINCKK